MKVNILELHSFLSQILLLLEKNKGVDIELNNDFYWDIPSEYVYNPYIDPPNLTLGQLSDDWNEVKRLRDEKQNPIPYDLRRLSNILKAISDENEIAF